MHHKQLSYPHTSPPPIPLPLTTYSRKTKPVTPMPCHAMAQRTPRHKNELGLQAVCQGEGGGADRPSDVL